MENLVILCVGSSKNICDSFGPNVGNILKSSNIPCYIYGKIDNNINALNIDKMVEFLKLSLGTKEKAERQAKHLLKLKGEC